jgi:hypothetical protein
MIDLSSLMTGVLVIGIVAGVIAATVFTVIPWSQDSAAKGNLAAIGQAERGAQAPNSKFQRYDSTDPGQRGLESGSPVGIQRPGQRLVVDVSSDGNSYLAAQLSPTGQVWLASSEDSTPRRAVDSGYVLASYAGRPSTGVSLIVPAGFVLPAGIMASVPQAMIHALVSSEPYFDQPVDPRVGPVTFTPIVNPADPSDPSGDFTWPNWTSASYERLQYSCGTGSGDVLYLADTTKSGHCSATVADGQDPILTIVVTANHGKTYQIQYDSTGNVR